MKRISNMIHGAAITVVILSMVASIVLGNWMVLAWQGLALLLLITVIILRD